MSEKVTHIDSGIRGLLANSKLYDINQVLTGGYRHKKKYFNKYFSHLRNKSILDIGCGTGIMLNYIDSSIEYFGCDMEEKYIDSIKNNFKGQNINLFCERVGQVVREEWKSKFDYINAHGLLHHLSDQDSKSLLEISNYYLKDGGEMITVDSLYHSKQSTLSKWLVSKDRGQNVRYPEQYLKLSKSYFENVDYYIDDHALNIPFSLLTMIMKK